jgi:Flp pilus assembly protein TadG
VHELSIRATPAAPDRRQSGQALVELALVVPILALVLAALVQLGLIYERQIGIENAIREAGRRVATFSTTDTIEASNNAAWTVDLLINSSGLLASNVQGYTGSDVSDISVCYRTETDPAGANSIKVAVTVVYSHPLFLPIISQILDGVDGINDSALRITTTSDFLVQNSDPASIDACYP